MKIFITGVAGFLGSHLADLMISQGHKVAGNDNMIGGYFDNVPQDVEFHQVDCCDLENMTKAMEGVDVVCHAAAYAHEGLSSFSPTLICSNNVTGSTSVFTAAIKNKVKRIVYCSSMARYGDIATPFKETDTVKPVDPYGVSKVAAENILKILSKTHNIEYNIAVPHNIIGPNQLSEFGMVVPKFIEAALKNEPIIIHGEGNQTRSFTWVGDVVNYFYLLAQKGLYGEIFNIGQTEEISIKDLAEMVIKQTNSNSEVIFKTHEEVYGNKFEDPMRRTPSIEKIINATGYEPTMTIPDMIKEIINYKT